MVYDHSFFVIKPSLIELSKSTAITEVSLDDVDFLLYPPIQGFLVVSEHEQISATDSILRGEISCCCRI